MKLTLFFTFIFPVLSFANTMTTNELSSGQALILLKNETTKTAKGDRTIAKRKHCELSTTISGESWAKGRDVPAGSRLFIDDIWEGSSPGEVGMGDFRLFLPYVELPSAWVKMDIRILDNSLPASSINDLDYTERKYRKRAKYDRGTAFWISCEVTRPTEYSAKRAIETKEEALELFSDYFKLSSEDITTDEESPYDRGL